MAQALRPRASDWGIPLAWLLAGCGAVALGLVAVGIADLDFKLQVVVLGLLGLLVFAALARDKWLFFLLLLVMAMPFHVNKQLSAELDPLLTGAGGWYFSSLDVLTVIVYGLWIVRGHFLADVDRTFVTVPNLLALLVIVATLPSLLDAPMLHRAGWELTRMLRVYALFFYALNVFRERRYAWHVLAAILVTGLIQTIFAVAQGVLHKDLVLRFLASEVHLYERLYAGQDVVRVSGSFIEPNSFAAIMAVVGAVGLSVLLYARGRALRLFGGIVCAGAAFSIALSISRSGMIGYGVAGILVVVIGLATRRISPRAVGGLVVVAALVGVAAWIPIHGSLDAKLADQAWEWDGRGKLHETALRMFASSPIVGVGLNNFQAVQSRFEPPDIGLLANVEVHSLPLLMLAEVGLLGVGAAVAYAICVFRMALPLTRAEDRGIAVLAIGLLAGISGIYCADTLSFALRLPVPMELYWLLTGLLFSMRFHVSRGAST